MPKLTRAAAKFGSKLSWDVLRRLTRDDTRIEVLGTRPPPLAHGGNDEVVAVIRGDLYVEPVHGYVITSAGRLLTETAPLNNFNDYSGRVWRNGLPSLLDFRRARRGSVPVREFDRVLLLRQWWEWNYFHFQMDVLAKLPVFEAAGLDTRTTPLILGSFVNDVPWVREILSSGGYAGRHWVVPDGYVRAREVVFCHARGDYAERGAHIARNMAALATGGPEERLFLSRRGPAARTIVNHQAAARLLESYRFREIDTTGMSIARQVELFSATRWLVAVHGAGLTNIIHRIGRPLSILELHADNYNSWAYQLMAAELGFSWDNLPCPPRGSRHPQHADFEVDLPALEHKITAMLDGAGTDRAPHAPTSPASRLSPIDDRQSTIGNP